MKILFKFTHIESILHSLRRLSETPGGTQAVVATHLLGAALSELLAARVLLQSRPHHRLPDKDPDHPMIGQKATSLDKPISSIQI